MCIICENKALKKGFFFFFSTSQTSSVLCFVVIGALLFVVLKPRGIYSEGIRKSLVGILSGDDHIWIALFKKMAFYSDKEEASSTMWLIQWLKPTCTSSMFSDKHLNHFSAFWGDTYNWYRWSHCEDSCEVILNDCSVCCMHRVEVVFMWDFIFFNVQMCEDDSISYESRISLTSKRQHTYTSHTYIYILKRNIF